MNDDTNAILERIAVSLERIARHIAPEEEKKAPRPATLTSAVYSREERELRDFRDKASRPKGDTTRPARTDL